MTLVEQEAAANMPRRLRTLTTTRLETFFYTLSFNICIIITKEKYYTRPDYTSIPLQDLIEPSRAQSAAP